MQPLKSDEMSSAAHIIASECVAVRIRTLNRAITSLFDEALRPLGLRVGQLNLLVTIARIGAARPSMICQALQMDKSTLSRDISVLRRQGWLDSSDSKVRRGHLQLSPTGRDLLEKALPAWQRAQERASTLIGDQGVAILSRYADNLWSNTR